MNLGRLSHSKILPAINEQEAFSFKIKFNEWNRVETKSTHTTIAPMRVRDIPNRILTTNQRTTRTNQRNEQNQNVEDFYQYDQL